MKQRHVAFVIEHWLNRQGGAERVLADVTNGLAERGYRVSILHHDRLPGTSPYALHPDVHVHNLAPVSRTPWLRQKSRGAVLRALQPFPSALWTARHAPFATALTDYARTHQPDALVAFMPPAIAAVEAADLPLSIWTVASTHNSPANEYENPNRWGMGAYGCTRRLQSVQGFDRITVLLPEFQAWHNARMDTDIHVVPNTILPVPAHHRATPQHSRSIVAIARLSAAKRMHLLLEAWAGLHANHPGWSLSIYGEGELKHQLLAQCAALNLPPSILKGHTNDVAGVLRDAALLAHPADQEGFCLTVGEALAAGVPCVGFADCPGVNTLIQHQVNGLLVPASQDSATGLRHTITTLMEDAGLRAALGQQGPQTLNAYTRDTVLDAWERAITRS